MTNLNWTQFVDKYKPIKNVLEKDPPCDGHLFQDKFYLKDISNNQIWTLIDNNDGSDMFITNGLRIINSLGYLIAIEPWTDDETTEVRLDESDLKQEENGEN